jgi:predicted enzyme related to lactoylglutathione lyase
MTYFGVDDADEAAEIATKLGGNVLRPPWDTPYGRMAVLTDDQGAVFAIMAMSQATIQ